jgi:type II secretory pathway component GspD/PulD (secretin)/tetratricopeptide (TPR) repeat protein
MTKVASLSIGLIVLCGTAVIGRAQTAPIDTAIKVAVQREADRITLRQKLAAAQAAEARKDLPAAAKLYEEAYKLVQGIGDDRIPAEREATVAGYTGVQLELARNAQKQGEYHEAQTHGQLVLKVDPQNVAGLALMKENDRILESLKGRVPNAATIERAGQVQNEKVEANTHVQNGRLLLEMGKIDEAEKELKEALKLDRENQAAFYYLSFVKERRYNEAERRREQGSKDSSVKVEQDWTPPNKSEFLPVPNPYATNKLIWTGSGRQMVASKLNSVRLDSVFYDGLPLSEVVRNLSDETKKRDPLKKGINFIINPNSQVAAPAAGSVVDPSTGLPVPAPPQEAVDVGSIPVKINPALSDMRLADVLDIIVQVADRPIKYSIEEWGIMFSLKGAEAQPLFRREFKVDPNTFYQGLESVGSFAVGTSGSSGGGGGGGGGGRGGGGGGGSQGGGQGGQGGGIGVPRVNIANGSGQTGGQGGGQGGQGGGGGGGGGVRFLTVTNAMEQVHSAVRNFFTILGVDLAPPKWVVWNDRAGILLVNASSQDLDNIEQIIQVLNVVPHQINIKAKFVEITQNDNRAIGFDWYLGNLLMGGHSVVASGGTAPTFSGPTPGTYFPNPAGSFPGQVTPTADTTIPISSSDGLITGGLRNLANAPALGTLTGILTDPQFRVVLKAMEQRDGVDLLNAPEVMTPSGRQAQIQIVDLQTIVSGTSLNQNGSGGTGGTGGTTVNTGNGGGGVVGTTIDYPTESIPVGTTLDVIPYISADGYTIQLTIIPTITEFVGYDDPGQFIPQAQGGSSSGVGTPIRAQLPLPRTRVRQVVTSAVVWDGQTVVLGGLMSEDVTRLKDKVPLLGDLPLVGRLFRSESSQTKKKNLVIFVTPTIIDPAGNRLHVDGSMPFDVNSLPPGQKSAFDGEKSPAR